MLALASLEAHLTAPMDAHHAVLFETAIERIDHYIDAAAINLGLHRTGG